MYEYSNLFWYYIGHIGQVVTVIYMYSFPHYLREGMLEGLLLSGLIRFGGDPGGGLGTAVWSRLVVFAFGIFNSGFGLSFLRLMTFCFLVFKMRFFALGMTTSSGSESSSLESPMSLYSSRFGSFTFFQRLSGRTFVTWKMKHATCSIHKTRHEY